LKKLFLLFAVISIASVAFTVYAIVNFVSTGSIFGNISQKENAAPLTRVNRNHSKVSIVDEDSNYSTADLNSKYIFIAAEWHIYEDCQLVPECDCCTAELYFTSDSTFMQKEICVESAKLLGGKYLIRTDSLILNFSSRVYHTSYDELLRLSHETNYRLPVDTVEVETISTIYQISKCENKIIIRNSDASYRALIGIEELQPSLEVTKDFRQLSQILNF